jgi:hypothetical protein
MSTTGIGLLFTLLLFWGSHGIVHEKLYLLGYVVYYAENPSSESKWQRALLAIWFHVVSGKTYTSTLWMEAICSSEMSVGFERSYGVIYLDTALFCVKCIRQQQSCLTADEEFCLADTTATELQHSGWRVLFSGYFSNRAAARRKKSSVSRIRQQQCSITADEEFCLADTSATELLRGGWRVLFSGYISNRTATRRLKSYV